MILYADTETFSSIPLREGVHAYSDAEDAEVMVVAWAVDDGPVIVRDLTADEPIGDFYDAVRDADRVVFHNSMFDRTMLRKCMQLDIPTSKIYDTMVNALCHGLPGGLGPLCAVFNLPADIAKDKRGKELIQMFCKPQPKNTKLRRKTRDTHPEEWEQFLDYAGSDILAMRELYRLMPKWSFFNNPSEHALWCLDQRTNDRGFGIDLDLVNGAIRAVAEEKARLKARGQELTEYDPETLHGVESVTRRDQLLRYALRQYGVELPDLRKDTLERRIADESLPEPLRELLRIRLQAASASSAKFGKALKVQSGGRIRGALKFAGAGRTQRWSGSLFQPQNLMRPDMDAEDIETFIEAVKDGAEELISDNIMRGLANSVRGIIHARPGSKLVVSDLANIEGRVLAWLAHEEWKLKAFAAYDAGTGPDLYYLTAANVLGISPDQVTKGQRQSHGKVPELACGYQGGSGAFETMGRVYGVNISTSSALAIVKGWREANSEIVSFWHELESAMCEAISNPGLTVHCRALRFRKQGTWLRIIMPSGKTSLSYADARIENGKISYQGINSYTRKWERIYTYGGKIAENVVQHVSRCVFAEAYEAIENAGYEVVLLVHDEYVTEAPDCEEYSHEGLSKILSTKPDWPGIETLPLAAAGFEGYRYRKD